MRIEYEQLAAVSSFELHTWRILTVAQGHDPRSNYVERFWLPVLGPSTTFLLRHLAAHLEADGEGVRLDASETAGALGLGMQSGRHSPFLRAIRRASDFDLVVLGERQATGVARVLVRSRLPRLSPRLLDRLPEALRDAHGRLAEPVSTPGDSRVVDRHAERLARTLHSLGAQREEILEQLLAWRVDPELAERSAGQLTLERR